MYLFLYLVPSKVGCDKFLGKNFSGFKTSNTRTWWVLWVKYGGQCAKYLSNFISSFQKKCDVIINHDRLVIENDPLSNFYGAGSNFLKFSQNISNDVLNKISKNCWQTTRFRWAVSILLFWCDESLRAYSFRVRGKFNSTLSWIKIVIMIQREEFYW